MYFSPLVVQNGKKRTAHLTSCNYNFISQMENKHYYFFPQKGTNLSFCLAQQQPYKTIIFHLAAATGNFFFFCQSTSFQILHLCCDFNLQSAYTVLGGKKGYIS